jgi:hypothetical protein
MRVQICMQNILGESDERCRVAATSLSSLAMAALRAG